MNSSGLGIALGTIIICAILFADDLLLIGKTEDALRQLMKMTGDYLEYHLLDISVQKSKVMKYDASTGIMVFNGSTEDDTYSLDLVLAFKYLGINVSCTPYKIFKAQREAMIKKAHCYKNSILSLVRSGPDRSELAYTIWKSCALLPES